MQRRDFLKGSSALALAGVGVNLFGMEQFKVDFKPKTYDENVTYHHLTCPRNCRDACSIIAKVVNGKMVDMKGNPSHPLTQGSLCVKGHTLSLIHI